MIVGLCQFDIVWEDKEANKNKIISLIEACKSITKIDWLIFPEMTLTGFSMNRDKATLSENDNKFFQDISSNYSLHTTFGGVVDGKNSLITLDNNGNMIANYAKMHLIPHYGENESYVPGDKFCDFEIMGMRVSPSICYDLRFSYLFWDQASITDIYVNIANWPRVRNLHWTTLLKARAIENQAYMIGVNRIGQDNNETYLGNSIVYGPDGGLVISCGDGQNFFFCTIEKNKVRKTRDLFPIITDRKLLIGG